MHNRSANVVIVGAGVVGSAVAFHLAQAGARDVLVLDRGAVGQGSSVPVTAGDEVCHFASRSGSSVLPHTPVIKMMVRARRRARARVHLFTAQPSRLCIFLGSITVGSVLWRGSRGARHWRRLCSVAVYFPTQHVRTLQITTYECSSETFVKHHGEAAARAYLKAAHEGIRYQTVCS